MGTYLTTLDKCKHCALASLPFLLSWYCGMPCFAIFSVVPVFFAFYHLPNFRGDDPNARAQQRYNRQQGYGRNSGFKGGVSHKLDCPDWLNSICGAPANATRKVTAEAQRKGNNIKQAWNTPTSCWGSIGWGITCLWSLVMRLLSWIWFFATLSFRCLCGAQKACGAAHATLH